MLHNAPRQAQRLVAFAGLRIRHGLIEQRDDHFRRCRILEFPHAQMCFAQPGRTLRIIANISGLQRVVDPARRRSGIMRRHDLAPKQKSRMRGQLNAGFGTKTDGRAIDDHHVTLTHFQHEIGHVVRVPYPVRRIANAGGHDPGAARGHCTVCRCLTLPPCH
jgi:hypothetical protein